VTDGDLTADDGKRIAILVDLEGLGDAVLKVPFLRAVKRAFPKHRIWWIASRETAMETLLKPWVAPLLDRVISHAGLTSPNREIIPRLRRLPSFDLIFDCRTRFASVFLARRHLKHQGFYACLPGYVLSDRFPPGRWMRPKRIAERVLTMIEAATGRAADWQGTFEVSAVAEDIATRRFPRGPRYVGLAPGSQRADKNWPLDRYIALASALASKGFSPAFLIGPQERDWLATLQAGAPSALFPNVEPVDPALGVTDLELSIALARRFAAAVANDSGIGHILAAIGTPLVSLFGPTDPRRLAPFGGHGRILRAQDFGGDAMEAIPVDAVVEALKCAQGI
jgi:ADP-heptose:LPS heptosyltransferase